ncbi:MAG TPA: response regulator [Nitrososphaeraceae archaeon]|jgi:DNA-binding response OmpR family regulator|nr:response regulator [Nitrososphaeraceae archaeon]
MNINRRILLVVDDEPDITLPFSVGLEDNGFVVDAFNDPLLALEAFKERKKSYALALLDIKMPKMDGFELYNEIRKVDDKVKVCFVTAFDIQKEDEEDWKAVTTLNQKPAFIRKPISIDDLVKRVKAELPDS